MYKNSQTKSSDNSEQIANNNQIKKIYNEFNKDDPRLGWTDL
jgi:hypothetical protein